MTGFAAETKQMWLGLAADIWRDMPTFSAPTQERLRPHLQRALDKAAACLARERAELAR